VYSRLENQLNERRKLKKYEVRQCGCFTQRKESGVSQQRGREGGKRSKSGVPAKSMSTGREGHTHAKRKKYGKTESGGGKGKFEFIRN